jgi:hypothetical protein
MYLFRFRCRGFSSLAIRGSRLSVFGRYYLVISHYEVLITNCGQYAHTTPPKQSKGPFVWSDGFVLTCGGNWKFEKRYRQEDCEAREFHGRSTWRTRFCSTGRELDMMFEGGYSVQVGSSPRKDPMVHVGIS